MKRATRLSQLFDSIATKLHVITGGLSVLLIATSPWILIGRRLAPNSSGWNHWHVYGGLCCALLAVALSFHVCRQGQWRQFFPWLVGEWRQCWQDISGLAQGQLPHSGGKGLLSVIAGIGLLLLLLVSVTGVGWWLSQGGEYALSLRYYHSLFADCFVTVLLLHALLGLLHLRDFFD
ncbi:cytochrome b/b6 domain-containing protein [Shewanella vesiculosa]|uniref:cytochrome b/b6 domain-containing protein n=1 Tax=Shewanella vesiculosa TaxID=518738 RepID=UPI003D0718C5